MAKINFSPLAPNAQKRKPEMVRMPQMANGFNQGTTMGQILTDSIGVGFLLGIAQLARIFMKPKPSAARKNINPKKQINPSTSYRPS